MPVPSSARNAGFLVLLVSVGLNVVQGRKIFQLENALFAGRPQLLSEGVTAPPLNLLDKGGKPVLVDYKSAVTPTLLYVFSPSCAWCRSNAESFRALNKGAKDDLRFIGISLSSDRLAEFTAEVGMDIPVYTATPATVESYGLAETPTTILLSRRGVVEKIWTGAYTGKTKDSIQELFEMKLPAS